MPIITHQLPKVPQLISPAVYHKAFRSSIEDAHALMVAFSYLHNADSYAKLLVATHRTPPGMTVTTATKQVKRHIRSKICEYYNTLSRFSIQYLCRDRELVLYKITFNARYMREDAAGLLYGSWDRLLPPGRAIRIKWTARQAPYNLRRLGGVTPPQQIAYVWLYDPYYRITNYN